MCSVSKVQGKSDTIDRALREQDLRELGNRLKMGHRKAVYSTANGVLLNLINNFMPQSVLLNTKGEFWTNTFVFISMFYVIRGKECVIDFLK